MKLVNKIITLDFLKGKKVYLSSVVLAVIGVLVAFKVITQEQATALGAVVGAFGMASLRKAM